MHQKEWRGAAPRTLSQESRGTTHHHNQRAPARTGGEPHPSPSARCGERPPTTTPPNTNQEWRGTPPSRAPRTGRPQPGVAQDPPPNSTTNGPQPEVAGNRTQDPQPGVARDYPPSPAARSGGEAHTNTTEAPPPPPHSATTAPEAGVAKDPPPRPAAGGGDGTQGAHRGRRRETQPQGFGPPPGDRISPT